MVELKCFSNLIVRGTCLMRFCEVTVILDDKQEERLEKLAERFKKINGWQEDEIMQFVINGMSGNVEMMLAYMELKAAQLENVEIA